MTPDLASLAERLRDYWLDPKRDGLTHSLCIDAADALDAKDRKIEGLAAQVAEAGRAAEGIAEWACDKCDTIYPGPPQKGLRCVQCPKCQGNTMPLERLRRIRAEAALAEAKKDAENWRHHYEMVANAWQRELSEQGIGFAPKSHWIDFMVLATRRVVELAKENGVRCCGNPELCANANCNALLRHRLSAEHYEYIKYVCRDRYGRGQR